MIVGNWIRLGVLILINALALGLVIGGCVFPGIALHVACVVWLLLGTLNPRSKWFGAIQTRTGNKKIWLTFDDGPDVGATPQVLALLQERGVRATFFVVGEKARKHPELVRRMQAGGHQIGNHTWSHPQGTFWCAGPWRTYREIVRCQEEVEDILGVAPEVFRAPVGHHNVFVHAVLRRFGLKLIGWSSRGFDGVSHDADEVIGRIKKSMGPGGIVLVHDDSDIALDVATAVIDHAEANGWSFIDPGQPSGR
ncbi:MAG: polysaccharide deacetylase family protein [Akkermansiaceae bacterium]|nr:polysaccharide deacetylase family protein [Akkermansiaceae bacterium]